MSAHLCDLCDVRHTASLATFCHDCQPPVCVCDTPDVGAFGECQTCYRPYRATLMELRDEWRHYLSSDVTGGTASDPAAGSPIPAATLAAADPIRRAATRRAGIARLGHGSPRATTS